jgi:DNA anti-recombination protein RmuC
MSMSEALNGLAAKISDLYREIVTTTVRFEELRRNTDSMLTRIESTVQQLSAKVAAIHDEHVREKATLEAQVATLQGRLTALSEQALHSVMRDVAREMLAERDQNLAVSGLLRGVSEVPGKPEGDT